MKTTGGRENKPSDRATIFNVAEKAGVSFVSVSRVFNEHPNVSPAMREKVFCAAREVGYQPRLVTRPKIIGILLRDGVRMSRHHDHFELCGRLFAGAARRNFLMEHINLCELHLLTQHLISGVIEVDVGGEDLYTLKEIPNIPVVLTQNRTYLPNWSSVTIDYAHEGALGISPFLAKGHRRVAIYVDRPNHFPNAQRLEGVKACLRQKGMPTNSVHIYDGESTPLPEVCQHIATEDFTGLLNFSHDATPTLLDEIFNQRHIRIPEELSLVTLDNSHYSQHYHPRVTSITQPMDQLADKALDELFRLLNKENKNRNHLLKSSFHDRCTLAPPPP